MSVRYGDITLAVPRGFHDLLEELAREILREQPKNIPRFASSYFQRKLEIRGDRKEDVIETANVAEKDEEPIQSVASAIPQVEPSTTEVQSEQDYGENEERAATMIQSRYRGYLTRRTLQEEEILPDLGNITGKGSAEEIKSKQSKTSSKASDSGNENEEPSKSESKRSHTESSHSLLQEDRKKSEIESSFTTTQDDTFRSGQKSSHSMVQEESRKFERNSSFTSEQEESRQTETGTGRTTNKEEFEKTEQEVKNSRSTIQESVQNGNKSAESLTQDHSNISEQKASGHNFSTAEQDSEKVPTSVTKPENERKTSDEIAISITETLSNESPEKFDQKTDELDSQKRIISPVNLADMAKKQSELEQLEFCGSMLSQISTKAEESDQIVTLKEMHHDLEVEEAIEKEDLEMMERASVTTSEDVVKTMQEAEEGDGGRSPEGAEQTQSAAISGEPLVKPEVDDDRKTEGAEQATEAVQSEELVEKEEVEDELVGNDEQKETTKNTDKPDSTETEQPSAEVQAEVGIERGSTAEADEVQATATTETAENSNEKITTEEPAESEEQVEEQPMEVSDDQQTDKQQAIPDAVTAETNQEKSVDENVENVQEPAEQATEADSSEIAHDTPAESKVELPADTNSASAEADPEKAEPVESSTDQQIEDDTVATAPPTEKTDE